MKAGDTAYIVESNRFVREVTIVRVSGGIYLIRFKDSGGGIQVKKHRLYATREDADNNIKKEQPQPKSYRSPYDWE
ncbi:MAG: hypothetical protein PUF75_05875 [Coprococcus sp.]|nr:hypothetical protein [Coprococcus sp.]